MGEPCTDIQVQELERSLSLLRATLDSTEDGILVVDCDGCVVAYNRRFLELWRIPAELAARRRDGELIAYVRSQLGDPDEFSRGVESLYADPERESRDVLSFSDGRVYERCSKPQRLGDHVVGRVWSFHDVTERERALAARDEFLAVAAHEIRGPLMSLQLAVQGLGTPGMPGEIVPRLLDIADRETHRLSRFVDQLLDVGRLRAGHLELRREPIDLTEVVHHVVGQMHSEIGRSGSAVAVRAERRPVGRWDRKRLEQVLTNLLSNALKFGEGRPVDVVVDQEGGRGTVCVTDHGIGIAPDALECIFEPFERRVPVRHYGGLGLGLHIVKTLVGAMGGTVRVTSTPGAGSTFRVELPLEESE